MNFPQTYFIPNTSTPYMATKNKKSTKQMNFVFNPENIKSPSNATKQNKNITFSSVEQFLHYKMTGRKPHPKVKFTPQEDELLRKLVNEYGENDNWNIIAKKMNITYRNVRQCKERWINYLSPNVNISPWTPEEDEKLEKLYEEFGSKWVQLAKHFPSRTDINIRSRWLVLQRHKKKQLESDTTINTSTPSSEVKIGNSPNLVQPTNSPFNTQFQYQQPNYSENTIFSPEVASKDINSLFDDVPNNHEQYSPIEKTWNNNFNSISDESKPQEDSLFDLSPVEMTTNDFTFFEDWGFQ